LSNSTKTLGSVSSCVFAHGYLALAVLRPLVGEFGSENIEKAVRMLHDHLVDPSQRLPKALAAAQQRAWRCLEITLAGESLWSRLGSAEDRALREQIRQFLDVVPLPDLTGKSAFREQCLRELRAVRKSDLLETGPLQSGDLRAGWLALQRYGDGVGQVDAEWQVLAEMAAVVQKAGHSNLAHLLTLRSPQGSALLVLTARYFFRSAVENDEKLFRGLALQHWERLQATQTQGLAALDKALTEHGNRVETALSDLHGLALDLRDEQRLQGGQLREVYQQVLRLQEKFDLAHKQVQPRDSLSIRGDAELGLVKDLLKRYRELPEQERRDRPALLNALSKLQVGTGSFDAARKGFQAVSHMVATPSSRAEACLNAYQAALEKHDWDTALTELKQAVRLDPQHCSLFPMGKYEPLRILGAGGFGVAFLCLHRDLQQQVVVKALMSENLDTTMTDLLNEPRLLGQLQHPAIIRVTDCGYIDRANRSRPYFVMDYFPGATLEDQTREQALSVADLLEVAHQMAQGLQKAHQLGVLHRDVKPGNVLVYCDAESGWQVKLIDFGLALKREVIKNTLDNPSTQTVGRPSIAGTLQFAAPEQLGLHSAKVDTYSDVYGFGKTCCSALFHKTDPKLKDWNAIGNAALQELLDDCTEAEPAKRPKDFTEVLRRLAQVRPTVDGAPAAPRTEKRPAAGDTQPGSAQAGRRPIPDTSVVPPGERITPTSGPQGTAAPVNPDAVPQSAKVTQVQKKRSKVWMWTGVSAGVLFLMLSLCCLGFIGYYNSTLSNLRANRTQRLDDLKQVALAAQNYSSSFGNMPTNLDNLKGYLGDKEGSSPVINRIRKGEIEVVWKALPPLQQTAGTTNVIYAWDTKATSNGKRLVVFMDGFADEISEAEFQAKPKAATDTAKKVAN
jgi:serine/threonine protein kinase